MTSRVSSRVEETEAIAAELARTFAGGECVALHGDLGAGKTQFVRGLVRGLGGDPRTVSSPTYVLLNVYASTRHEADGAADADESARSLPRLAVYHLDAYRVGGADDFEAIGFSELLEQGGVVVVEWAQRVLDLLPARRIDVFIEPEGENRRRIDVKRPG